MKAYAMVSADLFACLAVVFLVSFGIVAPLTKQEVLTSVEVSKTDKISDSTAPDARSLGVLEVGEGDSGTVFALSLPGSDPVQYNNYETVIEALEMHRPQELRLRVDRRVSSGIYQDLILDAQKLNIRTWQENERAALDVGGISRLALSPGLAYLRKWGVAA